MVFIETGPGTDLPADELVRRNIKALMEWRDWTQAEFAARLRKNQPWLSKRLTGKTPFSLEDMDRIAAVFLIPPAALLHPGGIGGFERRSGKDRRSGKERRRMAVVPAVPPD